MIKDKSTPRISPSKRADQSQTSTLDMRDEKSKLMAKGVEAEEEYAAMDCAVEVMNRVSPSVKLLGIAMTSYDKRGDPLGAKVKLITLPVMECEMRGTQSLNLYSTPQNSFLYTSFLLLGLFKKVEI